MLIGIIGAPNKGKSTLFSALTMNDVEIADYPFTTINPNIGVTYATRECIEKELGVKCKARNSLCVNGIRKLPVNIIDVAGLVEGAHAGKGMGNQFLNDLSAADALILVVDASGKTDANGAPCDSCDPSKDVELVRNELVEWIASIIKKHIDQISKRTDGASALAEVLTGLKIDKEKVRTALSSTGLSEVKIRWSDSDIKRFAESILLSSKSILIVANKSDVKGSEEKIKILVSKFGEKNVIESSSAVELAIRKAEKQGLVEYSPSSRSLKVLSQSLTKEQLNAINYMSDFVKSKGTNVQEIINRIVFGSFDNIIVYPVEDENKYTDHFGNVLPDAILMKRGSTALDLASSIHTEIGKNMLYAVDARSKRRLGKEYELKDNDVIRIVSAAK